MTYSQALDEGRPGQRLRLAHRLTGRLVYRRLRASLGGRPPYTAALITLDADALASWKLAAGKPEQPARSQQGRLPLFKVGRRARRSAKW
ncbi:hypothetical protein AB0K18_45500 [Nonomuraea sp. NPDC049421]|uniref:hypothetical protein n=1 Tax=Nonomuraea sp. NPDC049421 TaxID=3155275 RepID=UPI00343FDF1E